MQEVPTMEKKVISVDLDGTLTNEVCWDEEQCRNATPNTKVLNYVKKLAETNFIVFHTARRHNLYQATIEWLEKQGLSQWPIKMGKMPADLYLEDNMIDIKNINENI